MASNGSDIASRLEDLARRMRAVEDRLAALEGSPTSVSEQAADDVTDSAAADRRAPRSTAEMVPLVGRTLMVLAGAFVLRAVTDRAPDLALALTAAGIVYAILWVVLADRAAGRERRTSAMFHGVAAAMIAYPLLFESTVRFEFLSPAASAGALIAFTGLALVMAARRSMRRFAWVVTLGAAATIVALAVATKLFVLFTSVLLLLGVATLLVGYLRGWPGIGWLVALVVDGMVALLTAVVLFGNEERVAEMFDRGSVIGLQLALVAVYFAIIGFRTLSRRKDLNGVEIGQGILAVLVGIGGAITVAGAASLSTTLIGSVALALAAGAYGAGFVFIDRRLGARRNFVFYTTTALVLTLVALGVLLEAQALSLALAAAALLTAWVGGRGERVTLSMHAAVYIVAASIASGLLAAATETMVGSAAGSEAMVALSVFAVLIVSALFCWLPVASHGRTWGQRVSQAPKLLVLAVLVLGLDGIIVYLIGGLLPAGDGGDPDRAALAALRTVVLAVSAIGLGLAGRWRRLPEAAWLVYPVLVAGGVKLLLEDIRLGRPATMVVSFVFYGGVLFLGPRLARRHR